MAQQPDDPAHDQPALDDPAHGKQAPDEQAPDQWALVGALHESQRRAVYRAVLEDQQSVTRKEVADRVGITRALAAFHLDKLVDAGLLEVSRPLPGRGHRKMGRPAKRYQRSSAEIHLTVPARRYDLAGRIMARALTEFRVGEPPPDAARRLAHEEGSALARSPALAQAVATSHVDALDTAAGALESLGYAPARDGRHLSLGNCPFDSMVAAAPAVTCTVNLALIDGLLAGLNLENDVATTLCPHPGMCCITVDALA